MLDPTQSYFLATLSDFWAKSFEGGFMKNSGGRVERATTMLTGLTLEGEHWANQINASLSSKYSLFYRCPHTVLYATSWSCPSWHHDHDHHHYHHHQHHHDHVHQRQPSPAGQQGGEWELPGCPQQLLQWWSQVGVRLLLRQHQSSLIILALSSDYLWIGRRQCYLVGVMWWWCITYITILSWW